MIFLKASIPCFEFIDPCQLKILFTDLVHLWLIQLLITSLNTAADTGLKMEIHLESSIFFCSTSACWCKWAFFLLKLLAWIKWTLLQQSSYYSTGIRHTSSLSCALWWEQFHRWWNLVFDKQFVLEVKSLTYCYLNILLHLLAAKLLKLNAVWAMLVVG